MNDPHVSEHENEDGTVTIAVSHRRRLTWPRLGIGEALYEDFKAEAAEYRKAVDAVLALHVRTVVAYLPPAEPAPLLPPRAGVETVDGIVVLETLPPPPRTFVVCAHCRTLEDSPDGGVGVLLNGYRAALWPCPTYRALAAHITEFDSLPAELES